MIRRSVRRRRRVAPCQTFAGCHDATTCSIAPYAQSAPGENAALTSRAVAWKTTVRGRLRCGIAPRSRFQGCRNMRHVAHRDEAHRMRWSPVPTCRAPSWRTFRKRGLCRAPRHGGLARSQTAAISVVGRGVKRRTKSAVRLNLRRQVRRHENPAATHERGT